MKEYHDLLRSLRYDKPGYHFKPKNNEVVNKNWGKPRFDSNISTGWKEIKNENTKNNIINKNNNNESSNLGNLSQNIKEREYIRKEDNMSSYLTDDNNKKELEKYLIQQKEKRQKYYKEILDIQYKEIQNKNKNLYGTIDPLIVRREKRKILTDNPFVKKTPYDFGQSSLSHNPITNPENNIYYNKYLLKNNRNSSNFQIYEKNLNKNKNGHIFNNNFDQFKTIDNPRSNLGINNSKSSINIFRNNQNKNLEQSDINEVNKRNNYLENKINNKFNINNFENERNYLNLHSLPTPASNTLKKAGSSIFS